MDTMDATLPNLLLMRNIFINLRDTPKHSIWQGNRVLI